MRKYLHSSTRRIPDHCGLRAPPNETTKDPRFADVDNIFAEWNKADTPGCAMGVIEKGNLIYAKGMGWPTSTTTSP